MYAYALSGTLLLFGLLLVLLGRRLSGRGRDPISSRLERKVRELSNLVRRALGQEIFRTNEVIEPEPPSAPHEAKTPISDEKKKEGSDFIAGIQGIRERLGNDGRFIQAAISEAFQEFLEAHGQPTHITLVETNASGNLRPVGKVVRDLRQGIPTWYPIVNPSSIVGYPDSITPASRALLEASVWTVMNSDEFAQCTEVEVLSKVVAPSGKEKAALLDDCARRFDIQPNP